MNTLFLAQRVPYPPNKGEKIRTFHQIEYLLNENHRIFLCSPYTSEDELEFFEKFTQKYGVQSKNCKLGNKYLRYLSGILTHKPLSVTNFYSVKFQKIIDSLIANESFQNIVCTSSSMAEYIFHSSTLFKTKKRPKLVMDFMDLDSDKWSQYASSSSIPMRWIYKREAELLASYEKKICQLFDICFFISQSEVDLFCKRVECARPPLAIGNGIATDYFVPRNRPSTNDHPVFIFTGVMDYKPNIDAVVWFTKNVWPKIIEKYDRAVFIIAGMNPVPEIVALANIRGVEVTGFIDDILPYYHRSDIFVAPLRIARGVQNKILQSFSCGIPVVSTTMGAEGIDCTDEQDILIADTADDFFDNIDKLVNNTNLYNSIKDSALKLVQRHYSWNGKLSTLGRILE